MSLLWKNLIIYTVAMIAFGIAFGSFTKEHWTAYLMFWVLDVAATIFRRNTKAART